MAAPKTLLLGGGMTGLAAGLASGLPVYEAEENPGGICASYYVRPGEAEQLHSAPRDGEAYHFEIGGGHWIFGADPSTLRFIESLTPVKSYTRRSSVYLPDRKLFVSYPIQNHLRYLGPELVHRALGEIVEAARSNHRGDTMANWLRQSFGPTLCELFFDPFHELYTAGLWRRIAPQDPYKSPVNLAHVIHGAFQETPAVGYNATFVYPEDGLNILAQRMAERCRMHLGMRVVGIDVKRKEVRFADGTGSPYESLFSTIPLNRMMEITGLRVDDSPSPSPSVLVVNIGAPKGPECPQDHWVYIPRSSAGFHRVGFYSNVDPSFLPVSARTSRNRVSIYVEKAYAQGERPGESERRAFCHEVTRELKEWGWIEDPEVVDPTWIDVAYTWSWVGSRWREQALGLLEEHNIFQVGRYGRWVFQGIADSIRDGLTAGAGFRSAV